MMLLVCRLCVLTVSLGLLLWSRNLRKRGAGVVRAGNRKKREKVMTAKRLQELGKGGGFDAVVIGSGVGGNSLCV